jgi:hypothetical protein
MLLRQIALHTAWVIVVAVAVSGCSGAGGGNTAEAAEPIEPPMSPVDELEAAMAEMGLERSQSPEPPTVVYEVPPDVVVLGDPPSVSGDVSAEVALLRDHIYELERSLTFYMDTVVTGLREENAYLREELARIYATIPLEDRMRPLVPRPGSDVINEVQDYADSPEYHARANAANSNLTEPLTLTIAKEWGRTPDEAAGLGANVTSLIGLIGSVPQGGSDDALLDFARDLRDQYADYTNINIVIFDSDLAATAFAERNRKSTPRHVLTIARHEQSGLDEIYLHRNGLVVHTEKF